MARKFISLILFSLVAVCATQAEWNIETPNSEISGELKGEIFGNEFVFGDAT